METLLPAKSSKIGILATRKKAWELLEGILFVCFANEIPSVGSSLQRAAGLRVNPFSAPGQPVSLENYILGGGGAPEQRVGPRGMQTWPWL